jgi:hypothetical protein
MTIDFFNPKCESSTSQIEFGICDGEDTEIAYIDLQNKKNWICTVDNPNSKKITFIAIDKCIVIMNNKREVESSCDCMLLYIDNIVFIELKERRRSTTELGIAQIENTIIHFIKNHDIMKYKHKRAFVANRRHPNFQIVENETMRKFFAKYKVRLNIQAKVDVS